MMQFGPVALRNDGDVAVVTMNSPPVNALGNALRASILAALQSAAGDPATKAIVLAGTERAFSAGADITEFGKGPRKPGLNEVISAIENLAKPVVAFITGFALGGGLELALGCHYRLAALGAKVGLPEVKLGILPGAGGTQRLPRVIGPVAAAKAIVSGDSMLAPTAPGLLDGPETTLEAAIAFARRIVGAPMPRVRDREDKLAEARADASLVDQAVASQIKRARGQRAPAACLQAVRASFEMPFQDGLAVEGQLFAELVRSPESRAQRHAFFAEREALKVPGVPPGLKTPPVSRAVLIGAGKMGGGIAMCFANVGIPVTLIERQQEQLDRGLAVIEKNYRTAVSRGSMVEGDVARRMSLFTPMTDFNAAAEGDVVIEAVFETMEVKQDVFTRLDAVAKPDALLASNTSTLNVDQIAAFTKRPESVLGMHFFSRNRGKTRGRRRSQAGWARPRMMSARRGTVGAWGTPILAPR